VRCPLPIRAIGKMADYVTFPLLIEAETTRPGTRDSTLALSAATDS
jgi:hypothetical protein